MKQEIRSLLALAAGTVMASPALAGALSVRLTLPSLDSTSARHPTRPYVAVWVRHANHVFGTSLAVWYQIEDHHGRRGGPDGARSDEHWGWGRHGADSGDGPVQSENTPGGARWMNGVREWWADSGHTLKFPVDGLTSASRPAGTYELTFESTDPKLAALPPGQYLLVVEAAREHGGDETVTIPFSWPLNPGQTGQASGKSELGAVELKVLP